jgi:hypothetical protein
MTKVSAAGLSAADRATAVLAVVPDTACTGQPDFLGRGVFFGHDALSPHHAAGEKQRERKRNETHSLSNFTISSKEVPAFY